MSVAMMARLARWEPYEISVTLRDNVQQMEFQKKD